MSTPVVSATVNTPAGKSERKRKIVSKTKRIVRSQVESPPKNPVKMDKLDASSTKEVSKPLDNPEDSGSVPMAGGGTEPSSQRGAPEDKKPETASAEAPKATTKPKKRTVKGAPKNVASRLFQETRSFAEYKRTRPKKNFLKRGAGASRWCASTKANANPKKSEASKRPAPTARPKPKRVKKDEKMPDVFSRLSAPKGVSRRRAKPVEPKKQSPNRKCARKAVKGKKSSGKKAAKRALKVDAKKEETKAETVEKPKEVEKPKDSVESAKTPAEAAKDTPAEPAPKAEDPVEEKQHEAEPKEAPAKKEEVVAAEVTEAPKAKEDPKAKEEKPVESPASESVVEAPKAQLSA